MQPQSDYKQLLTDVIKKQIVILGPDITLAKARNVPGLTVADDGTVTAISGEPQQITQSLIDQFVQLSGLIVKKTMEPLLSYRPNETAGEKPTLATTPPATPSTMPMPTPAKPETQTTQVPPPITAAPISSAPMETATINAASPTGSPIPTPIMPPSHDGPVPQVKPIEPTVSTAPTPSAPAPAQDTNTQHQDQIDAETQKIIDEALKSSA